MNTTGMLRVTDSRTGRSYELPIADGAIRAVDLRQIKASEEGRRVAELGPGIPQHRELPQRHYLHRRGAGSALVSGQRGTSVPSGQLNNQGPEGASRRMGQCMDASTGAAPA
jgi:hypothetical protein